MREGDRGCEVEFSTDSRAGSVFPSHVIGQCDCVTVFVPCVK